MCETTAALFDASAGVADSSVLNGPPSPACQHCDCEVELIHPTGQDVAASAAVGATITPPTANADATPMAVQIAVARFRKLSSLSMLSYRLPAQVLAIGVRNLDVQMTRLIARSGMNVHIRRTVHSERTSLIPVGP